VCGIVEKLGLCEGHTVEQRDAQQASRESGRDLANGGVR
jgi:hypothetical protein